MKKLIFIILSFMLASSLSISGYAESSTQYVKSSAITADVKAKFLADPDIKSTHISVKTVAGNVTLHGYVANEDLKKKAVDIARQVNGVKSIKDDLMIIKTKKS